MSRFVDRGAITAAYVGIGMAVTIGVSFLLVIPIEAILWLLAVPAGAIIGYYANARSDRRNGPWRRIMTNAFFAATVTGLTLVVLLLLTKALFFYADSGYPDFNRIDQATQQPVPPYCTTGADCVYARYLAAGRGPGFESIGVSDVETFTAFYWREQFGTAGTILVLTVVMCVFSGMLALALR